MGGNSNLKCPGMDRTLSAVPVELNCPYCQTVVEIWSDEQKRHCTNCATPVYNPNPTVHLVEKNIPETPVKVQDQLSEEQSSKDQLAELLALAMSLGSSDAKLLSPEKIIIEKELANLCREARCPNYGLSPTCPPEVDGAEWLIDYLKSIAKAIVIKIETPHELMYSDKRKEITKLLHFIVIQLEKAANDQGFHKSRAFAGGSCKNIFCSDYACCNVLKGDGKCRNPDQARPSVSGFGINMNHLLGVAGWSSEKDKSGRPTSTSSGYGLVLVG